MFNYISFFLSFLFAEESSESTGNTRSEYSYLELVNLFGSIVIILQGFLSLTYFILTYFEVL